MPNPARDVVRIGYAIPEAGAVRLSVYDLMGREISVLVDGVVPAGPHTATWDGGSLSAGVYVYRLEANGIVRTRMVTLAR